MVYQNFNNSKQKIQKNWERSEDNENNLKDIPLITLDFNSISFNKKLINIPIITNKLLVDEVFDATETILLENFPTWAINMIEPTVIYTLEDGFTSGIIHNQFTVGDPSFKVGDVFIALQKFKYWFNHIDQSNFLLKVFYTISIKQVTIVEPPNIFTAPVPTFITLSLKIINQRLYELMNEKSE